MPTRPSPARVLLAPRLWGLHLLAVLATTAAVLLGLWQYDAWQSRREDQAASRVDAAPKPLADVLTSDQPFPSAAVGQPVRLAGRWLPGSTVYVEDRVLAGRRGVWAVTPVAVCGGDVACAKAPALLVVRGWSASVADAPPAPTGRVEVTGWLQPGEGSGVRDDDPTDDVIPELRIADAIQHVDQDLYGGYVVARGDAEPGLAPVTPDSLPEAETFTALRNLLYALEWWVFGGFAVFVWVRWCRDEVARAGQPPAAGPPEPAGDEAEVSGVTGVPSGP